MGTISFLFATSSTLSAATVDLLALFHNATLLPKELRYTLREDGDEDKYLSISLLAARFNVGGTSLMWQKH